MNRNSNYQHKFETILFTIFLGVILSTAALAQSETNPVDRSELVGVGLPPGALRVNDANVPAEIAQTLEKIVAQGDGKLRQGDKEVLLWTGRDLKNSGAMSIVNRLTNTLTSGGWQYEVGGTENGVTLFSVLKHGASPRAVIGFYGEADDTFIFAWTELHAASGHQTNPTATIQTGDGSVADYSFTTPAGWSRSDAAGRLTLSKDEKSVAFLPPMESSGNLERDADRILWQVFKGYGPWSGNGFEPDYGTFEKGRTVQGLEYFRAYRYAKRADEDNASAQSRFDAIILLVKLGGKVAVIVGRQPFQSDYASDSVLNAIDLVLFDLKFKSAGNSYDLKSELLGSWSAASGSVGLSYTFNANGSFDKGAASQFRTSHDAYRDKVTTTSYGMTESYSVSGNILTQNYKRTGQVVRYKIRIYDTKYNKDAWQHKVGFLSVDEPGRGTMVLKKDS